MITLAPYSPAHEEKTLSRIARFFAFHNSLVSQNIKPEVPDSAQDEESRTILSQWLTHPSALYVILDGGDSAGFLRICYRGSIVAWIEDIFVDEERRGKGIATYAIRAIEEIVKAVPGYQAVCLDVAPRNMNALKLYHKLGYTDLSLMTVRKELGQSKRDKPVRLFDLDFFY